MICIRKKKECYTRSVTIRKVLNYWDLIFYIPIFGTVILVVYFVLTGIVALNFWQRFQDWLDKEI